MKKLFIVIAVLCIGVFGRGQILKDLSRRLTNDAQSKVEQKISSKMDQGLDSLTKKKTKTKSKNNSTTVNTPDSTSVTTTEVKPSGNTSGGNTTVAQQNDQSNDSGYIKFSLSSNKILTGGTVTVSGTSIMYGSLNAVDMTVTGPSTDESKKIPLKNDGSFSTTWQSKGAGNYKIMVKSSNGKGSQTSPLDVYPFEEMDLITGPGRKETERAYDKLKSVIDGIKSELTASDANDLQQKMEDVTKKKNKCLTFLDDLDNAGKGLDEIEKKYGSVPPSVTENLSQLDNLLSTQATHMEQLNDIAQHEAYDNSICEDLVMVNEACAAFITFTEFYARCPAILASLASDRVVGPVTGAAGNAAGASEVTTEMAKETAKIFSAPKLDADWGSKMTEAGLAGEITQMCNEKLMKKYCVVMSGDLKHDYQCTFKNEYNNVWWQYNYTTEATISLRYPRDNKGGSIIKMKGNIEGNATKFSIYQKASEIDEFREAMKNRAQLYAVLLYAPPSMPFSSARADKNVGFGAVARAIVTPAYFNIPIDADYDVQAKKLKIYLNAPLMDFNPSLVRYIYCYITFPLGIPLTTRIDYPINSVKLTLGKVIEKNNDFNIETDKENNLFVNAKGSTQVGQGTSIEHHINFSFSMKSE